MRLGRACSFYGLPIFRRLPGSSIVVGEGCQFRSAPWANLIGLNRACIVTTIGGSALIDIGRDCGFSGTVIGSAASITIGSRVMCGANTTITDTDWHPLDAAARQAGGFPDPAPVIIGDDVWLGMNVTVLKGVAIGDRTVVAAGSVVSRSLPADVVAAGQPAVPVRRLAPAPAQPAFPSQLSQAS